jgi:hypothetical protein
MEGLPGYDNWKLATPPYCDPDPIDEDEGLLLLKSAIVYLRPRADADEEEQVTGEFEAVSILEDAADKVRQSYTCRFCAAPTVQRNTFCSRGCARADREGL